MNFELNEDQLQIQSAVGRWISERYGVTQRAGYLTEPQGWSKSIWLEYAELGLTAIQVPACYGGLAGSAIDQYVVMRELGSACVVEPYVGTSIAAVTALLRCGSDEQRSYHLPRIVSGESTFGWAHGEGNHHRLNSVVVSRASQTDGGFAISGEKTCVLHGDGADYYVVSAMKEGVPSLFLVEGDASGVSLRRFRLVDGSAAADVRFDNVAAVPLGNESEGHGEVIASVEDAVSAALCAEAVGAMKAALDLTVRYLNTRMQFGKALASNQALRHRCADMAVMLECSESMAMLAAISMANSQGCEPGDLHSAKVLIARNGRSLCELAIQLHGGIGMTEEYGIGRYLQRLMVFDQLFGSTEDRVSALNAMRRSSNGTALSATAAVTNSTIRTRSLETI